MKIKTFVFLLVALLVVTSFVIVSFGKKNVTGYVIGGSEGRIEIKGSDTLLQLVSNLAEAYSNNNPSAKISVTGGGSGTGIAALINGEVDVADASRKIKDEEIKQAQERGSNPWEFIIARDMLSVIVHGDNGVDELTIEQLSRIYKGEITNWKDVGGDDKEITLYGRQSTSGTYVFFMEHVVKDDYSSKMRNMEGNQAILDAVKQDKTGIGYVGIGYLVDENGNKVSGINVVKVSDGGNYISPLDKGKISEYPLSRPLFQYLTKRPNKGFAIYDFLIFELSSEGQNIVEKAGFVEITSVDREHNEEMFRKL